MSMTSEESGANDQKPTMEIRASLGEFSIFVSGRVCDNWWPEESNGVRVFNCIGKSCLTTACLPIARYQVVWAYTNRWELLGRRRH